MHLTAPPVQNIAEVARIHARLALSRAAPSLRTLQMSSETA
nr:hypothetical protein [Neisseria polysaccharea]